MLKRIIISVFGILAFAILGRFIYTAVQQNKEFEYHTGIPKTITLGSSDFNNEGVMPIDFTGNGKEISPELHWKNLPEGTQSLVLLCTDYDGPSPMVRLLTIDHWVLYNIPADRTYLSQGSTSKELKAKHVFSGKNFKGTLEYKGPKPPLGKHRYFFRVYALSVSDLDLLNPTKQEVMSHMKKNVLAYGELIGIY